MTREKIEDIRFIVIPFVVNILKGINYEGQGDSDAKEFIDDFNVIFDLAIKALEQEPISETDIILTREEYGELVSSEYDNGYAKGYREALEQEPIIDKIRAEIVKKHLSIVEKNGFDSGRTYGYEEVLDIIDKYKAESEQ